MKTKTCSKCGQAKDVDEFPKRYRKRAGQYHAYCKLCFRDYRKIYDKAHPKPKNAETLARLKRRNQDYVWEFLITHSCVICGEDDPIVLEFDHIDRDLKKTEVSILVCRHSSISKLQEEMDKCRVLCCNCHRRETIKALGWWRSRYM